MSANTTWRVTARDSKLERFENDQLPGILIVHDLEHDKFNVIEANHTDHGWYDSLAEAAGIAKHLTHPA